MDNLLITVLVAEWLMVVLPSPILFYRLYRIGGRIALTMALFLFAFNGLASVVIARLLYGYLLYPASAISPMSAWGGWVAVMMTIAMLAIVRVFWE